ncbi:hypothetical protein EXIGLDRAFT_777076 [Exidia glandulosa HHB12029]|uniref:Uncharacterized protein n=1 Tax=Exidia glandulosa HHB12029 TaxID=1314781 RepID=A0A165D7I1_EXIGL|nr:hypothetical protein EXIGLDRAFT_777076 [Exidia glandulosa HHB12029]
MPCLESLCILYELEAWRNIETVELWRDGPDTWELPSLRTIEFAPVVYRDDPPPEIAQPIAIRARDVLQFLTRQLPSAHVSRVILKGVGIHLESEADEQLPFALSHDPYDRTIHVLDHGLVFNGFDSGLDITGGARDGTVALTRHFRGYAAHMHSAAESATPPPINIFAPALGATIW